MKKCFLLLTASFFMTAAQGQIIFQKIYGSYYGSDWGREVQQTTDHGYILAGYSDGFTGGDEGYLAKTDSLGDTLWTKLLNNLKGGRGVDHILSIRQTTDGGYILVGDSYKILNGTNYNICLIKTDSNGDTLWTKSYLDTFRFANIVRQTLDGGYMIFGNFNTGTSYNAYLMKTNSIGDTLWTKTYRNLTQGYSAQQTSNGGYILVGSESNGLVNGGNVYLVKTNSNGDSLWTKTFGGIRNDEGRSVQQTNDGGYIITGYTESIDTTIAFRQVYLIRTDSNGDTLWTKKIGNQNSYCGSLGNYVQQIDNNGFIVAGTQGCVGQANDVYLIKTNSNGDTLWTRSYGGADYEFGYSAQQTADKGFVIFGMTDSYGVLYDHYYLIKTDSVGHAGTYLGITEQSNPESNYMTFLPNPFSTQTTLQLAESLQNASLTVYNSVGQTVKRMDNLSGQTIILNRDNLPSGLYFVRLAADNKVYTGKLVITDK